MGMLNILIAIVLLGIIIYFVVRLLPSQDKKEDDNVCPKCGGSGRIEELRGKVLCPKCKGTGKVKW